MGASFPGTQVWGFHPPSPPPSRGRKHRVPVQNSPPLAGGVRGGGSKLGDTSLEFDFFQILRYSTVIEVREAEDLFGQPESCL